MFSIIIPYYNKANYIQRCIHSILNQSLVLYEIIIVNDGSTDDGLDFLSKMNNEKITLITQENKGVSEARNTGIKNAKYQYIAFLDADDCWHTNYLEKIKQIIDKESDIKIIGANYSRDSDFLNDKCLELYYFKFDDYFKSAIRNTYFTSSSTIIASSFFDSNNGFNSMLKSGEDSDVWFRAVQSGGNAFYIKNKLVYYSDEDENQTTKIKQNLKNSLVGNINVLYADSIKTSNDISFKRFVSKYVYFNLYPYYFDKENNKEAKNVIKQNKYYFFWLHLLYLLPISMMEKRVKTVYGSRKIRLYLKFIMRFIHT